MSDRGNGRADAGPGRNLKRYQERFEPVVTRVLLLGIFVTGLSAQFVKPIGDALEGKAYLGGALLSLVGYVLYDQVKDLASSVRAPVRALVNSSQLGTFVSEAFEARKVEISFLGYTGRPSTTPCTTVSKTSWTARDRPGASRSACWCRTSGRR